MRVQIFGVIADSDEVEVLGFDSRAADVKAAAPRSEEVAYAQFEWWARLLSDARFRHESGSPGAGTWCMTSQAPAPATAYRTGPQRALPAEVVTGARVVPGTVRVFQPGHAYREAARRDFRP